jgi:hypothetical protein
MYTSFTFCAMGLVSGRVLGELASRYGVDEEKVEGMLREAVEDVAEMLSRFVRAGQYSFADRLANAAGREVVSATLYEALRISESTRKAGRTLDENVVPYVAKESSVKLLLDLLDVDLVSGLEVVKRAAILALAYKERVKEKAEEAEEAGGEGGEE